MSPTPQDNLTSFFVAGINYKKTDAAIRGSFAINTVQYQNILQRAPQYSIGSLFIISTCNRTEIYGIAENAAQLIKLLCSETNGDIDTFIRLAYVKNGLDAIEHLFDVGAGLDSQILGDYEITGQLKQAVKFAKDNNFINCFMERLINGVLQSSKQVRNETALSSGTVSVAYAAIEYIRQRFDNVADKNILVVGTGKIGRNACKNLIDYLGARHITLVNRTEAKAIDLAAELGLKFAPANSLQACIDESDIILVASNAEAPVVRASQLKNKGNKLIIDLSIPYNVEAAAVSLENVTLVNVDGLSKINDDTLLRRQMEIPGAKAILSDHIAAFIDWCQMRKNAPVLNAIKSSLSYLYVQHFSELGGDPAKCPVLSAEKKIQQVINNIAGKMKTQNRPGCQYLEAINEFMVSVAD